MENLSPTGCNEAKTEAATDSSLAELQTIILAKRALTPHQEIRPIGEQLRRLPSSPNPTGHCPSSKPELDAEEIRRRSRRSTIIQDSGIPRRHLIGSREHKPTGRQKDAVDRIVSGFDACGSLFALLGPRGGGKTQVAVWAMQAAADREMRSLFTTAQDMFRCLRTAFRSDMMTEAQTLSKFKTPALLVIDELNERAETAFEDRSLIDILNHRYNEMRHTVLISNHQPEEFSRQVGSSVMDRLTETGNFIKCDWPSFRTKAVR